MNHIDLYIFTYRQYRPWKMPWCRVDVPKYTAPFFLIQETTRLVSLASHRVRLRYPGQRRWTYSPATAAWAKVLFFLDHWRIWHGLDEGILNVASCISRILPCLTVQNAGFVGCGFLSFICISLTWAWSLGWKSLLSCTSVFALFNGFSDFFSRWVRNVFWRVYKSHPHKQS